MQEDQMALAALRDELSELRNELHGRVRKIRDDMKHEVTELEKDVDDQAIQLENDEVLDRLEPSSRALLRDVMAALDRMDLGEYGICEDCGDEIGLGRLRVIPYARRCLQCQEDAELRPLMPPTARPRPVAEVNLSHDDRDFPDDETDD